MPLRPLLTPAQQDRALVLAVVAAWAVASLHVLSGRFHIRWDSTDFFFPQTAFVVAALRRGEAPWWNPHAFAGAPVLGDPQGMIFTPHALVGWLAGNGFGLSVFDATTLAVVLIGGLCLMAYARGHGAAPALAALGALVFILGGYATSRLQHVTQVISYAWLPVLLLAFRHAVRRPGPGSGALLGLAGLGLLLNPNQIGFLAPFLLGPLLLVELAVARRPLAVALTLAGAGALALAGAAPSLSAILETVAHSVRSELGLDDSAPLSVPGFGILSTVLPGLFGTLPHSTVRWPPMDLTEAHLYLGILPAIAIGAGLARATRPPPLLVAAWIGAALAFLFMMGVHGPLFPPLFEHVPGFDLFRRPSDAGFFLNLHAALAVALTTAAGDGRRQPLAWRVVLPALLLVALAAAWPGLAAHAARTAMEDSLARSLAAFAFRLAVLLAGAALLLVLFRGRWRGPALTLAALTFTTLDFTSAGRVSAFTSPDRYSDLAPLLRKLARAETLPVPAARDLAMMRAEPRGRVEIHGGSFALQTPIAFGVPLAQGYNPLRLSRYADTFGAQNLGNYLKRFTTTAPSYSAPAYRWLGVDRVLLHGFLLNNPAAPAEWQAALSAVARDLRAAGASESVSGGIYVAFMLPGAHPRGSLAPAEGGDAGAPIGRCEILRETTTHLSYRCAPDVQARLVVPDSFAPGWIACVNGRPTPVEPFLGALRAVRIEPSPSLVTLDYRPVPWLRHRFRCPPGA